MQSVATKDSLKAVKESIIRVGVAGVKGKGLGFGVFRGNQSVQWGFSVLWSRAGHRRSALRSWATGWGVPGAQAGDGRCDRTVDGGPGPDDRCGAGLDPE